MATSSTTLPLERKADRQDANEHGIPGLIPGILLLAVVGYAGKFIEQSIARYGKAHHQILPNIEYVLWAIVIGMVIANTVGLPRIFRAGVATYEFWLKAGIILLGARFILGDVLHLSGHLVRADLHRTGAGADVYDLPRPRLQAATEADHPARRGLERVRRLRYHRHAGGDRRR